MKYKDIIEFILRLNIFLIPFYIIILFDIRSTYLIEITKNTVLSWLNSTGIHTTVFDSIISVPIKNGNWGAEITWDCVGWKSMFLFLALVMATKTTIHNKIKGLFIIPIIYIINIARIWFMFYYVINFDLPYFSIVHTIIWGFGLTIIILILWYLWLQKT